MGDLAALPARFQASILSPDDDAALADLNDSPRETVPVLFGVYRHAYGARLIEVLQANFDQTWGLLGDQGFAPIVLLSVVTALTLVWVSLALWPTDKYDAWMNAATWVRPALLLRSSLLPRHCHHHHCQPDRLLAQASAPCSSRTPLSVW